MDRILIRLAIAGIMVGCLPGMALAQGQPASDASPTSLAIPRASKSEHTPPAQAATQPAGSPPASAPPTGAAQGSRPPVAVAQTATPKTAPVQNATPQVEASQKATAQSLAPQVGAPKAGTAAADTPQTAAAQTGTPQSGTPQHAGAPQTVDQPGGVQTATPLGIPRPGVHRTVSPAAVVAKGILVTTTQHSDWGRVSFVLHGNPAPEVHAVPDGVEVRLAPGVRLEVPPSAQLRETGAIGVRDDNGTAVALIHFSCHCTQEQDRENGVLRLNIRPAPTPAAQPDPVAKAATETKIADNAKPDPAAKTEPARTGAESKAEIAAKPVPATKSGPAATQDTTVKTAPDAKPETAAKTAAAARSSEAEEMARLRAFLTEKLAKLNANPPQVAAPAPTTLMSDAAASRPTAIPNPTSPAQSQGQVQGQVQGPAASVPGTQAQGEAGGGSGPCLARVDAANWRGSETFTERLVALRTQAARSQFAPEDVAAISEFYLANGLGHEAMAAASEALAMDVSPEVRLRLARDADIGSLIRGVPLAPDSPLLSNPANCKRPDAALWRGLAAAAGGDAEGAARDPETLAASMRPFPVPMRRELAFRIVAAVGDNLDALRAMAGVVRNATIELPEDDARRFLLQARIAGLTGDQAEYAVFLERAARFDMTPAGITAKARLAAIRAGEGGPGAARNEAVLIDIARTYRHDALGQQAAEQYAELQLRRHDYATALAIADESAGPRGSHTRESRGASLVLRILRMLFVDPATSALPDANERIALYLRYGGYTTPGEKGDDVRLAAAQMMLTQRMPAAALDTLHQLSDTGAATPEASRMLALAEAFGGDPAHALELAQTLPNDMTAHRVAAEALRRMRQPLQAAHVLDGATELADRERRAGLLFEAEAWADAVTAYTDLLRDPVLPAARRNDLATRYALAVAMTGSPANVTGMKLPEAPAALLAAVPQAAAPKQAPLSALRGALERARRIETLLDPPTVHQGS